MSKKRDDLEAIVDLLHDWCIEHGEDYVSAGYAGGIGHANIWADIPDHNKVNIFKEYDHLEDTTNEAQ